MFIILSVSIAMELLCLFSVHSKNYNLLFLIWVNYEQSWESYKSMQHVSLAIARAYYWRCNKRGTLVECVAPQLMCCKLHVDRIPCAWQSIWLWILQKCHRIIFGSLHIWWLWPLPKIYRHNHESPTPGSRHDVNYKSNSMTAAAMWWYDGQTFARNLYAWYQRIVIQPVTSRKTSRTCNTTIFHYRPTRRAGKKEREKKKLKLVSWKKMVKSI